jgi:hypothetical protein
LPAGSATTAPPPELAPKLTQLIEKLSVYKKRCDALRQQRASQQAEVKRLKADVDRLGECSLIDVDRLGTT